MWRSAVTRRRRHTAVAAMVETATRTGRFHAPWDAVPEIWQCFHDEYDLLGHLEREWRTALAGAVYVAIEAGHGDLQEDVSLAFSKTLTRHRGTRRVLEANADHPAIAAAMRKERALLSTFAGLSGSEPQPA